jgi:tRNA threonylcarbamoyl adenosine modification protein (Sua5/YciO/YrdC/YwlC family)
MTQRLTLAESLAALGRGDVVALPTDTVYGVAASLSMPEAVAALFTLKRRPESVALPILVEGTDALTALGVILDERATRLAARFWPGPLTIIVPAPAQLARVVRSSRDVVGVRVPSDETLLALLRESGPLAVTSANEHGSPPCTSAEEVLASFEGRDELFGVFDDGIRDAEVSSVIDVSGPDARVLRHGAITEEELLGEVN